MKTVSIIVTGKVQGVYYRQSTREKARDLNITGEVKNMPDDSVFIVATGTDEQLNQFIGWCKIGPPRALVTDVVVTELPIQSFDKFSIVH